MPGMDDCEVWSQMQWLWLVQWCRLWLMMPWSRTRRASGPRWFRWWSGSRAHQWYQHQLVQWWIWPLLQLQLEHQLGRQRMKWPLSKAKSRSWQKWSKNWQMTRVRKMEDRRRPDGGDDHRRQGQDREAEGVVEHGMSEILPVEPEHHQGDLASHHALHFSGRRGSWKIMMRRWKIRDEWLRSHGGRRIVKEEHLQLYPMLMPGAWILLRRCLAKTLSGTLEMNSWEPTSRTRLRGLEQKIRAKTWRRASVSGWQSGFEDVSIAPRLFSQEP